MASLTLRGINDRFAEGTTLGIYPRSNFGSSTPPVPGLAPLGAATDTSPVSGDAVTFDGLADDTAYVVTDASGTKYLQTGTLLNHGQPVKTGSNGRLPGSVLPESEPVDVDQYLVGAVSFSAGVAAAIVASSLGGTRRAAISFTTGKQYVNDGAPISLAPISTQDGSTPLPGLTVYGNGAKIKGTASARRLFDFARTGDGDTNQHVKIYNLGFDRNNLTSVSNEHVFAGNLVGGSWPRRVNVDDIEIEGCWTENVPVSSTIAYENVSIGSQHLTSGEGTTNTLTNIFIRGNRWQGGTYGFALIGGCNSVTVGLGVEVFYDNIVVTDNYHDPGVVPTAGAGGANIQIGGYAYGGRVYIDRNYGANSPDTGDEVDGARDCYIGSGETIVDSWNMPWLIRNFRKPGTETNAVLKQINIVEGTSIMRNIDPGTGGNAGHHFQLHGDTSTAGYVFGTCLYLGHAIIESKLANLSTSGIVAFAESVQFHRLVVRPRVHAPNLDINPASNGSCIFIGVHSVLSGHSVDVAPTFVLAGQRSGASTLTWKMVRINGTDNTVSGEPPVVDTSGLAGLSAADTFRWVQVGGDLTTSLRGRIPAPRIVSAPVGGGHNGVFVASTATLTISGVLPLEYGEMAKFAAIGTGFDYNIDSTQIGKAEARNIVATSSRSGGVITARTAVTSGFTSGDLTSTSPVVIRNTDPIKLDYVVKGGTVSLIERSDDNSTYDTVAAATGAAVANVKPGQYVRITYSAAPTVFKRPAQ